MFATSAKKERLGLANKFKNMKLLFQPTPDQAYCIKALLLWVGGDHHLPKVHEFGCGVAINFSGDLSTWDGNRLPILVLIAHRYCIRIEIAAGGPGRVKVIAHRRDPKATSLYKRHPDIGELITMCGHAARLEEL